MAGREKSSFSFQTHKARYFFPRILCLAKTVNIKIELCDSHKIPNANFKKTFHSVIMSKIIKWRHQSIWLKHLKWYTTEHLLITQHQQRSKDSSPHPCKPQFGTMRVSANPGEMSRKTVFPVALKHARAACPLTSNKSIFGSIRTRN